MKPTRDLMYRKDSKAIEKVNADIEGYSRFCTVRCPFCGNEGGEEVDGIDLEIDRDSFIDDSNWPEISVKVECEKCNKKSLEYYRLTEIGVCME